MLSRRAAKYVALLLLLGLLIPTGLAFSNRGSTDAPSAEELAKERKQAATARCAGIARRVADQIQVYVSAFDEEPPAGSAAPAVPSIPRLRSQVTELTARVGGDGCDAAVFRRTLARDLRDVRSSTDLGAAVAGTLVANVRDVLEPGTPREVEVGPGEDLFEVFSSVPSGSTLSLAPGTFRIDRPLVVLQDVTVTGAGAGRTRILSTAADAALLQPAPSHLSLGRLTLSHTGREGASLLLLRAGSARLDRLALTGATTRPGTSRGDGTVPDLASGGNGVIAAGSGRLVVTRSRLVDNEAAGLVASGAARPRITGTVVADNALCGVCFLGRSGGVLDGSTLRGNQIGVLVGDRATPTVRGNQVVGNTRAGVVSQQRALPRVEKNRVRDNEDIGIAVYNRSGARLEDNTVAGHRQVGIVVSTDASADPRVRGNTLTGNAQAGIAFLGTSRGSATGNRCSGGQAALVLGGTSAPRLARTEACPVRDERNGGAQ